MRPLFRKTLRGKYDVVIMYDFSRDLDEKGKKNLRDFVESGKGIVVLHHALLNYQKWAWWYQDVVGGSYRLSREGDIPSSTVKNDQTIRRDAGGFTFHHVRASPLSRSWMKPMGGCGCLLTFRPLLITDNPTSSHVVAWIGPHGGRLKVVAIQIGHGPPSSATPRIACWCIIPILWAAGRIK